MDELIAHHSKRSPAFPMTFEQALSALKSSHMLRRTDGPHDIAYVSLYNTGQRTCDDRAPYFFCVMIDGRMNRYTFSDEDLLSNQWRRATDADLTDGVRAACPECRIEEKL